MTRVAALLPAATGIVVSLGAAELLVAMTHACRQPVGRPPVPRVTRSRVRSADPADIDREVTDLAEAGVPLFELDERRLAGASPDVLLTQAVCDLCAVREEDVLAAASRLPSRPVVVSLSASTVQGMLQDIVTTGDAIGLPDEAAELVAGLRSRIRSVHQALKRHRSPRPRVAVIEWTEPVFGAGHWVPDMVRRAGGEEVIGRAGVPSTRVTPDQARAADPGVIVVAPCGVTLDAAMEQARRLGEHPDWRWADRLPWWAMDANTLTSSPDPAIVHGIEVLACILHPGIFGEPPSGSARRANGG